MRIEQNMADSRSTRVPHHALSEASRLTGGASC
jgi:hypothetical protein